jgi:hypothetical protein
MGAHAALCRVEYVTELLARAGGASTVDKMGQLANTRQALIALCHKHS